MILENAYIFILIFLVLAIVLLIAVFVSLQKRAEKNIIETFKKIFFLISPALDCFIIWIDSSGKIFFANDYALKFLETADRRLQGANIESIFASQQDARKLISLESEKTPQIQTNFISKNNELIPVQLNVIPLKLFGRNIGHIISTDNIRIKEIGELNKQIEKYANIIINQQKSQEEYIYKIQKLDAAIKNIFKKSGVTSADDSFAISATKNNLFTGITDEFHNFFNSYLTTCWIIEGNEDRLKLLSQFGLSESGINKFEKDAPTSDKLLKSLEQKRVITEDISSVQNSLHALLREEGVQIIVEVPFFSGEKVGGVIEFYLKSNDDLEINKQLFNHISTLLTAINNIITIKLDFSEELRDINNDKKEIESRYFKKIESCERDLKELQEIQELTTGRELIMYKLKGEIEELKTQLSKYESNELKNKS